MTYQVAQRPNGRCVPSSTCEVLVLSVRNVEVGLGVTELLGETKIDRIDLVDHAFESYLA
ncbi:hypothetical protein K443DRAFT_402320 [Laccaria amethystina LaAM-08-1]|jgi:hypothetical protein|uniref:Uncharacterized protein n=1 Tax=Laccaria amethystina LaAM-08-1 TaxID=1095629 RepID=A0A0C9WQD2_9AGAR|nr:hypothetical protein K443DRAFT_402320 [Laccaria amethystina LaAM-08-1]